MNYRSISERILKASAAVFIAHLCFKLVGFVQFFVVGVVIETNTWEAIYGFAFDGVIFSLFLIGEELIGPAFLPMFSEEKENIGESAAWNLANTFLTCQFLVLCIVVLLLILFPEQLTKLLTYWNRKNKPEMFELAVQGVNLMAPALICFSLASTTYMILNSYKKFFMAAFGDAVWKGAILLGVIIGIGVMGMNWKALAVGVLIGSVAKLVTHLIGLVGHLSRLRPAFNLNNPAFKRMLWLMVPLLIGIVFAKFRDFYNYITVLSSLDMSGLIKANAYGRKLFQAVGVVVPYTLSIAMFPFFCDLVTSDDEEKLGGILDKSSRMLMVFFIPAAMFFLIYSTPFVQLLIWGKFSARDAYLAGISMACYTLVLPAYSLEMLFMQAFFAKRKMVTVTVIGITFSTLSMLISYIGIIHYEATGVTALMIVALGYVLSRTCKAIALISLLKKSVPMFVFRDTFLFLLRVFILGLLITVTGWGVLYGFDRVCGVGGSKIMLIIKLAATGGAASIVYCVGVYLLKISEPVEMLVWAKRKLTRTGTPEIQTDE